MSPLESTAAAVTAMCALYFAWTTIALTLGTRATLHRLLRAEEALGRRPAGAGRIRFRVILPMLREDRVVEAACLHFRAAAITFTDLEVVIVTTRHEALRRDEAEANLLTASEHTEDTDLDAWLALAVSTDGIDRVRRAIRAGGPQVAALLAGHRRPTTAEAAQRSIAEVNAQLQRQAFTLCDADVQEDGKVGQMNAGLADLPTVTGGVTYVAVFDADSRPDLRVFAAIEADIAQRRERNVDLPSVYQQVSCYCRNVAAGAVSPLVVADAVAQTRWALGFEFSLLSRYSDAVRRGRARRLAYCIGHGCFVSTHLLDELSGFPTWSRNDDLALGYAASLLGREISPVAALDFCDVAPSPLSTIRQSRFWFLGSARFAQDLAVTAQRLNVNAGRRQRALLLMNGFGRNLAWAGRAALWLVAVGLASLAGQWTSVALLVALHIAYVQIGFVQTVKAVRLLGSGQALSDLADLSRGRLALAALAASPAFIVRSLGPLTGVVLLLMRRAPSPFKTER